MERIRAGIAALLLFLPDANAGVAADAVFLSTLSAAAELLGVTNAASPSFALLLCRSLPLPLLAAALPLSFLSEAASEAVSWAAGPPAVGESWSQMLLMAVPGPLLGAEVRLLAMSLA